MERSSSPTRSPRTSPTSSCSPASCASSRRRFLARFPQRVVNTHPALLPCFPGAHAVADALAYGVKVTGVTVHLVDEGVDTGPVVAQAAVPVLDGDDEAALQARIQEVERPLYVDAVGRLAREGWTVEGRTVRWT